MEKLEGFPQQFRQNMEDADKQAKEIKEDIQFSKGCGASAYAELRSLPLPEEFRNSYIDGSVRTNHLYIGRVVGNFQAEKPVKDLQDYIQAIEAIIEQYTKKAEEGSDPRAKKIAFEARYALEGFGERAILEKDPVTAQQALEYTGYFDRFPDIAKKLAAEIEEIRKKEKQRVEKEKEREAKLRESCGIAAYAKLKDPYGKNETLKKKVGSIRKEMGSVIADSVYEGRHLSIGPHTNIQTKSRVENPQQYIEAFRDFIRENTKRGKVQREKKEYPSSEIWAKDARLTLEGFGKAAEEAGDKEISDLVRKILEESRG